MSHTVENRRFVECPKRGFKFYTWETYTEIDDSGMAELTVTLCPAIARGQGYDKFRCNGLTEFGFPCLYANGKFEKLVKMPKFTK